MVDDNVLVEWKKHRDTLIKRIRHEEMRRRYEGKKMELLKEKLIGRYYLEEARKGGQAGEEALKNLMDKYLVLDAERALFGLLPLDKKSGDDSP